jgi:2-octaprenyl-6-methoxyphenol hydroxylase
MAQRDDHLDLKDAAVGTPRGDILIAGAGIVGRVLATALKSAFGSALTVTLCDPTLTQRPQSGRAYALTAGPRRMLETLNIWPMIVAQSQPIHSMIVTDSRTRDPVRPVFLNFSGDLEPGEPFAHMVLSDALVAALDQACRDCKVEYQPVTVTSAHASDASITVSLSDGKKRPVRLLVAADGARSPLREQAGIATIGWDYRQSGIVATVAHEGDHEGRAEEHFLPAGPFAILPLCDRHGRGRLSSIVWTEGTAVARRLMQLEAVDFERELVQRFGHRLGEVTVVDQPQTYPIGFQIARQFVGQRLALVGDAAHLIHPIAGQGLNLGLRDVAALAEIVADQVRLGLDIGSFVALEQYEKARRFDCVAMAVITDQLNRLFSNDAAPVRLVRDFGLGLVERIPGLKTLLIRQASGTTQARLLRGEAV